jgi:predicted secreted protein
VVVAHCHLDVNTKVHGLADYAGARLEVIAPLLERGIGIVQLPCPEATFLGMCRWGMTREQYDVAAYRRHCERILAPTIDTLRALADDGCVIEAVVGVDGSPSCGVGRTCVGYEGGEIEALFADGASPVAHDAEMPGVFIEVLKALLDAEGLSVLFRGVDED